MRDSANLVQLLGENVLKATEKTTTSVGRICGVFRGVDRERGSVCSVRPSPVSRCRWSDRENNLCLFGLPSGDGRAPPAGGNTIASSFVDPTWQSADYQALKQQYVAKRRSRDFAILSPDTRNYSASRGCYAPRNFAPLYSPRSRYCWRIGQRIPTFVLLVLA